MNKVIYQYYILLWGERSYKTSVMLPESLDILDYGLDEKGIFLWALITEGDTSLEERKFAFCHNGVSVPEAFVKRLHCKTLMRGPEYDNVVVHVFRLSDA